MTGSSRPRRTSTLRRRKLSASDCDASWRLILKVLHGLLFGAKGPTGNDVTGVITVTALLVSLTEQEICPFADRITHSAHTLLIPLLGYHKTQCCTDTESAGGIQHWEAGE